MIIYHSVAAALLILLIIIDKHVYGCPPMQLAIFHQNIFAKFQLGIVTDKRTFVDGLDAIEKCSHEWDRSCYTV